MHTEARPGPATETALAKAAGVSRSVGNRVTVTQTLLSQKERFSQRNEVEFECAVEYLVLTSADERRVSEQ